MRKLFYMAVSILMLSCIPTPIPITPGNGGTTITVGGHLYTLTWSEEFNYTGLPDPAKWGYEVGYVRNGEAEYYTDHRLENCKVENGILHLTALNDSFEGHPVTSASIITKGLQSFKYGYLEVRAKMPHLGIGTWPAIWTLGDNIDAVGWPRCGEMDIMEWLGRDPSKVMGTLHMAEANDDHVSHGASYTVPPSSLVTAAFHNYAVEWDSTKIKFFFDNINYGTFTKGDFGATPWDAMTKDHYLILNLAMGGGFGGTIDYTKFPYTFEVEYVRYYK